LKLILRRRFSGVNPFIRVKKSPHVAEIGPEIPSVFFKFIEVMDEKWKRAVPGCRFPRPSRKPRMQGDFQIFTVALGQDVGREAANDAQALRDYHCNNTFTATCRSVGDIHTSYFFCTC
jgi:hypothetical protein